MQPQSLLDTIAQLGELLAAPHEENIRLTNAILWDALDQYDEQPHLWHYAAILNNHLGRHALAAQCLRRCYELESNPVVLSNLGKTLRMQQRADKALAVLEQASLRLPDHADTLGAIAACYVNEGNPLPGIEAGERSLALEPDRGVMFNLGLLHLEAGHFAQGFDYYAEGEHRWRGERLYSSTSKPEPPVLTPELHEAMKGQGKRIVVYGEQGIGDEIMFSTMLDDVRQDYFLIFDCHPRLESLHRSAYWTWPSIRALTKPIIIPERKDRRDPEERSFDYDVDAKIAMGDLCRLYRRELSDFTQSWIEGGMLHADEGEVASYRKLLEQSAKGRKIVGLAMRGGTMSTATKARRLNSAAIEQLFAREDCFFVGLDYEDMTATTKWAEERFGSKRYIWNAAINFAWDYSHVAALIRATDLVITVPQSVAHLSAALGHDTIVLNPVKTAWREACVLPTAYPVDYWYWYGPNARMLRQTVEGQWPIDQALSLMDNILQNQEKA